MNKLKMYKNDQPSKLEKEAKNFWRHVSKNGELISPYWTTNGNTRSRTAYKAHKQMEDRRRYEENEAI